MSAHRNAESSIRSATRTRSHSWAAGVAPGLASTAADNDPSGIATYSLAGTQYGFDMLAASVWTYPLLVALQLISARIAALTGLGLTANIRKHEPKPVLYFAVARFLLANLFNIVADIIAMGIGMRLLCRGPVMLWAVLPTLLSTGLQWFVPYPRYARIVQWLTTGLFAYAAALLIVDTPWKLVALRSFVPQLTLSKDFLEMLLAVLGTTVSPYLLFSQAEQEAEELHGRIARRPAPEAAAIRERHLRKTRKNILIHTACSNGTAWFMLAATATTLHAANHPMLTLTDAAAALDPAAGYFAREAFGLLLIGSALLALPLLAGSAANSAVSAFGGPHGEQRDRRISQILLALMAAGLFAAALLLVLHLDPVRILYWSAVFSGATVSPIIVLITLLSSRQPVVGEMRAHWILRACGWLAAAAMSMLVCAWLASEMFL